MILDEPLIFLRLTNQVLAIAIVVAVSLIIFRHLTRSKFDCKGSFAITVVALLAVRVLMATFGDTGVGLFGDTWRNASNGVSLSILLILLGYLVWDIKYHKDT